MQNNKNKLQKNPQSLCRKICKQFAQIFQTEDKISIFDSVSREYMREINYFEPNMLANLRINVRI